MVQDFHKMTILQSLFSPRIPFSPSTTSVVNATGGNDIAIYGTYKVHIFTGPGTFTVISAPSTTQILYWVIGGGGGGGAGGESPNAGYCGGGGGGGGFRSAILPLQTFATPSSGPGPWTLPVTVGAGGAGGTDNVPSNPSSLSVTGYGFNGSPSTFAIRFAPLNQIVIATGGGGGASYYIPNSSGVIYPGNPGGSGGGTVQQYNAAYTTSYGGLGNAPPAPPTWDGPQGYPGGSYPNAIGPTPVRSWGSGGGGAGGYGGNGSPVFSVPDWYLGGIGKAVPVVPINYGDPSQLFAGGGEGGTRPSIPTAPTVPEPGTSPGYSPGGGGRKDPTKSPANPGLTNTGGGGAGVSGTTSGRSGGAGAPGIVVVAYLYQ